MLKFFHKLFNPHCEHCKEEREENRHCNTCEVLREILANVTAERDKLLRQILEGPAKQEAIQELETKPEDLVLQRSRFVPSAIKRQMMFENDKRTLQLMKDKEKEIKEAKVAKSDVEDLEDKIISAEVS